MGKTKSYYDNNPEAREKKSAYDKKYGKKTIGDRVARNAARRALMAAGRVKKGDGMDVDHVNGNPQDNRKKNWRVMTAAKNRAKK